MSEQELKALIVLLEKEVECLRSVLSEYEEDKSWEKQIIFGEGVALKRADHYKSKCDSLAEQVKALVAFSEKVINDIEVESKEHFEDGRLSQATYLNSTVALFRHELFKIAGKK